ncbi:uncharacterized protein JCM6883_004304 [Sporobolomyces salmoneus]|uniref:uncharacterized protein n=1 Tax=Sporobolomyces salmoneus TaxID=183962 RepID=UPI0031812C47
MSHESRQHNTRVWNDDQRLQRSATRASTSEDSNNDSHHFYNNTFDSKISSLHDSSLVDRHLEVPVYKGAKGRHLRPDTAFHPYKSSQGSHPPPLPPQNPPPSTLPPPSIATPSSSSKPIQFIESTFQPGGDLNNPTQTTSGGSGYCRPKREKVSQLQLSKLLKLFETTDNPSCDVRDSVGAEISMSNREVQVWFQNRRAKVNREKTNANEKGDSASARSRPPSKERAPSPRRPTPTSITSRPAPSDLASAQHQWRFSNSQPSRPPPSLHQTSQAQPQSGRPRAESVPRYRKTFGDQRILLPRSSSPLPSPEVSSTASDASSYFANSLTPPSSYTATTPGTDSSSSHGHSFPLDCQDRKSEDPSHLALVRSPATAFRQLALNSPPLEMSRREPFFHTLEMPSPPPPEEVEYIRLAPMRSNWANSSTGTGSATFPGARRRSLSTSELVAGGGGRIGARSQLRLRSIQDLLNPVVDLGTPSCTPSSTPSLSCPSTAASPVVSSSQNSPFFQAQAPSPRLPTPRRPLLTTRHSSDAVPTLYRADHRQFPSHEGGLTGLGVLNEHHRFVANVHQSRPYSMYQPY